MFGTLEVGIFPRALFSSRDGISACLRSNHVVKNYWIAWCSVMAASSMKSCFLFFHFFSLLFSFFPFWEDWWIEWLLFYIGKRSLLALSNLNWLIGCENSAKFRLVKFFTFIYHPGYALFGEARFVMCNLHPYNKYKTLVFSFVS